MHLKEKLLMKLYAFSKVLMNIRNNFVRHKLLKCNYRPLPWMNLNISSSFRKHAKLTKLFYKCLSDSLKELLVNKSTECSNLIVTAKENYQKKMAEKLDNPFTAQKHTAQYLTIFYAKQKLLIFHL